MQKQLTAGHKHSDLDTSYSKSKDVELAVSYRSTFGNNRVTQGEDDEYKPPQNILKDANLNKTRSSLNSQAQTTTAASQRFQITKALTLEDRIEIQKLKFMKFDHFVDSLELNLDITSHHQKYCDQNIYFFQIKSKRQEDKGQEHTWLIRRRYLDLVTFDQKVRRELKQKKIKLQMPDLPFSKEPKNQNPQDILNFLEAYLKTMISLEHVCKTDTYWEFIELSDYNHDGIVKVKETFIKKRSGGHFQQKNCFTKCMNPFNLWKRRYVVITSEGIMYSIGNRTPKTNVREMMLFDHNFDIKYGKMFTQREFGIALITTTRRLQIEAYDLFHFVDVIAAVKDAMRLSPYIELHRYDSFAPIRQKSFCQWYVDGEGYFSSLYEKLINANYEVFITDWWLSPQMYLQRPVNEYTNQETRLDRVLQKIADKGVKVYIIVYREPTIALNLNSNFTKSSLQSLHKNIKVMRHPSTLIPLLWSHHEKMVVIDQLYGFLGGLDICYGRWDTQSHPLTDQNPAKHYFPGIDYSNARVKDFEDVKEFTKPEISRETQPRMPWHDIAMMVIGEPVRDMVRHFIQYWNFAKLDIYSKDSKEQVDHLIPGVEDKEKSKMSQVVSNYWHKILSKFRSKRKTEDDVDSQNNADSEKNSSRNTFNNSVDSANFEHSKTIPNLKKNKSNRFCAYLDKIKEEQEENQQNHIPPKIPSIAEENKIQKLKINKINCDQINDNYAINDSQSSQREENSQPNQNISTDEKNVNDDITLKNILDDLTIIKTKPINNQERESSQRGTLNSDRDSKIEMSFMNGNKQRESSQINGINESMILPKLLGKFFESPNQTPISNKHNRSPPVLLNNYHDSGQTIGNDQKLTEQFINNIRYRKSEQLQVRNTRSSSLAVNPSIQNRETYKPFNLEYEDMHELNKYNLYVPLIEKLRRNYEESADQDQNYYIPQNIKQSSKNGDAQQTITNNNNSSKGSHFFKIFKHQRTAKVTPYEYNNNDSPRRQMSDVSHNSSMLNYNDEDDSFDNSFGLFPKKRNFDRLKLDNNNNTFQQKGSCICQMLRSSCSWSLGLEKKNHEMSIQLAYIDLITSSTSYIYIENQFFISCSAGSKVKNLIAQALIERIKKAADNDEVFKVVVVMPLLPGFAGEVNDSGAGVMKCQLHWEYSTISRGGTSILEELRQHPKIEDPSKYIQFYGLRQHGIVDNKPATEIIYVHSKLMIVDDNYVIMGSANINDRSMLGTRDSEIAMIVEDTEKVLTSWNEQIKKVGKFSHTLRTSLYLEHFGLTQEEANDPLCGQTDNLIISRSKQNTLIYREAFACYPDEKVQTISQLDEFQKSKKPETYYQYKDNIIGNAVELPLDFLKRENLNFSISQKEYFVPDENFT